MHKRLRQVMIRRAQVITRLTAAHDQDWEACKEWWRAESIDNRKRIISEINSPHADPYTECVRRMASLTLDRLVLEVWPGPGIDKDKEAQP